MLNFKKAIIAIDGNSSRISDKNILINIRYALSSLGIPYQVYKPHTDGFKKLQQDMNQEDTLYVLNDSLQFHLCEKPHIVIVRSTPWVQCTPKLSTIGIFCQEMIGHDASQMIAAIGRSRPVRKHHDLNAATTYILVNDYTPNETHTVGRYGLAAFSYSKLIHSDIHSCVLFHQSEGLPKVNEMLKEGLTCFTHPDDLLIITNRDICLVPEATAIIRAHMDTHRLDACYAKRVDCYTDGLLNFNQIKDKEDYEGIDLFVFRPGASCIADLVDVPLTLGRAAWDNFWADRIGHKLPYNICYHIPHESIWATKEGDEGNKHNMSVIDEYSKPHFMGIEHYDAYFKDVK
jgi:hypothetical protein